MLIIAFASITLAVSQAVLQIFTEEDLKNISACLACSYVLQANISLSSSWAPLGNSTAPFHGSLNGQGNTITFAGFSGDIDGNVGLFSCTNYSTVYNLRLLSTTDITALSSAKNLSFGLLAGSDNSSSLYGCLAILQNNMPVLQASVTIGALLGTANRSIINGSYANVSLASSGAFSIFLGGILGNSNKTQITGCETHMNITIDATSGTDTSAYVGGIVAVTKETSITSTVAYLSLVAQPSSGTHYIGGAVALENSTVSPTFVAQLTLSTNVSTTEQQRAYIGGAAGLGQGVFSISNSSVSTTIKSVATASNTMVFLGGVIGLANPGCYIGDTRVNAMIALSSSGDISTPTAFVGGMIGNMTGNSFAIIRNVAIIDILVSAESCSVGGMIGMSAAPYSAIWQNGVLGVIAVTTLGSTPSYVGGFAGAMTSGFLRADFFIGNIAVTRGKNLTVGALVGLASNMTLNASFALANISVLGETVTAGGIAILNNSTIRGSYLAVNVTADTTTLLILGGLAGSFSGVSAINDSFVVGNIAAGEKTVNGVLGGLIATIPQNANAVLITRCYAWGLITVRAETPVALVLGGFIGTLETLPKVLSSLAYMTMKSTQVGVTAGLLIGRATQSAIPPVSENGSGVQFSVMYVSPSGGLSGVKLLGGDRDIPLLNCYCADYSNTKGCVSLYTLNTKSFLKNFDFAATFQFDESLVNGSLALQTIPMPQSRSTFGVPRFRRPNAPRGDLWQQATWMNDDNVLSGFLFSGDIDYRRYCGPFRDCHGVGTSPVDVFCAPGWSFPAMNRTSFADSLRSCDVFQCSSSSDCNDHGTCSSGVCSCHSGYSGLDCAHPICPETNGSACGFNECLQFSPMSLLGMCVCQRTQFLATTGLCMAGCPPIGLGVCVRPGNATCFAGYSPDDGCLNMLCSTTETSPCNGRGSCESQKCVCNAGSILLAGNCYTPCSTDVTADCIILNCGESNGCSGQGICVPTSRGDRAFCVCNANSTNVSLGTHFGGALCDGCEIGYVMNNGACVLNSCQQCIGGQCQYNSSVNAVVCACEPGQVPIAGTCVVDSCGPCRTGRCRPIPYGASLTELFCICSIGYNNTNCYSLNCPSCTGGVCTPNAMTMTIDCIRPQLRSNRNVVIILCVVIIGGAAIIAAVVATGILCRRRRRNSAMP